jgi:hypothetical protein
MTYLKIYRTTIKLQAVLGVRHQPQKDREISCGEATGAALRVGWDDRVGVTQLRDCELLLLDHALDELSTRDPRQGRIVELVLSRSVKNYNHVCFAVRGSFLLGT